MPTSSVQIQLNILFTNTDLSLRAYSFVTVIEYTPYFISLTDGGPKLHRCGRFSFNDDECHNGC